MSERVLTSITIHGLRGFGRPQTLSLALPGGVAGSGLTVLVGPNNSGKSTIVEALDALAVRSVSFHEGLRNAEAGSRVLIEGRYDDGEPLLIRTEPRGGAKIAGECLNQPGARVFRVVSRRYFESRFGSSRVERRAVMQGHGRSKQRASPLHGFIGRLFHIDDHRKEFDAVLKRILPDLPDWYIEEDAYGQHYLKFPTAGGHHDSDGLGDGLMSLFVIVDALYDSAPGETIVIDEPELSLHPSLQRQLMKLFIEYATDRQIVLCTHSPYFVDLTTLASGSELVRMVKRDGHCELHPLSRDAAFQLRGMLEDRANPHVLGLDAREVMFLDDHVILTEGQEDVIYYERILAELGIDSGGEFYGWGVGGASKMKVIVRMLRDVGFRWVVGLLDQNAADTAAELTTAFPDYYFVTIPADDVRTKPPRRPRPAVVGLVDESGRLRPETRPAVQALFEKVHGYLRGE